jgi:putative FmdB family regulatory protein
MRTAAKRDENERRIIKYLLRVGCKVHQLSQRGVPDLLVGIPTFPPYNLLMEVKMPSGKLTSDQSKFIDRWGNAQVAVVQSVSEVKEVLKDHMPVRMYTCEKCGRFEKKESFHTNPLDKCPTCGKIIRQVYSVPHIVFKGGGWAGKNDN